MYDPYSGFWNLPVDDMEGQNYILNLLMLSIVESLSEWYKLYFSRNQTEILCELFFFTPPSFEYVWTGRRTKTAGSHCGRQSEHTSEGDSEVATQVYRIGLSFRAGRDVRSANELMATFLVGDSIEVSGLGPSVRSYSYGIRDCMAPCALGTSENSPVPWKRRRRCRACRRGRKGRRAEDGAFEVAVEQAFLAKEWGLAGKGKEPVGARRKHGANECDHRKSRLYLVPGGPHAKEPTRLQFGTVLYYILSG
ncbi:hypothetical protein K438DRAFT_1775409 [Mycena galopus ATCC 62051]|nr:hypothetical protein K438DRAFT_1783677 [Mycena galopus ATCC 62051]KAF8164657.1 hypothetical protein K438DRAFT_1775409 [Mycena galopus ATCC 62051]